MANSTFKIPLDPMGEAVPSKLIPSACFTTDSKEETTRRFYAEADGSVAAGIWECDPCQMDIDAYPVNEQMTIISGKLVLTNEEGVAETFGPGEVLFVSRGSKFNWHITERLQKYFMTSN